MSIDAVPPINPSLKTEGVKPVILTDIGRQSVLTMAQAEMANTQNEAMLQAEDLGIGIGGRVMRQAARRGADERFRTAAMHKMVIELGSVDKVEQIRLLHDASDWTQSDDPMARLLQMYPEAEQAALRLGVFLAHGDPDLELRRKLERGLSSLMGDDSLSIALFGALMFGQTTPVLRQGLRRLYHRAQTQQLKLSQWLQELGEPKLRQRKLRAMLHIMAYELSASGLPIIGSHLAAVMTDLQQLGRILSVDYFCTQGAAILAIDSLDGEVLLQTVVKLIEQIWIDCDYLIDFLPRVEGRYLYRLTHGLAQLFQLLPIPCFSDVEQKNHILSTLMIFCDKLLEDE